MPYENIHSHAQIQSLQARSDELARSDEDMLVNLVSLESVRMAAESYALLRPLVDSTSLVCSELPLLSVVAGLALELHKLEHDLLPQVMDQEAKLERGVLEALLLMKNSAITLLHLGKAFKEALVLGGLLDEDLVSPQVEKLSIVLQDSAVHVLEGKRDIVWLREQRVPWLIRLFTALSATPPMADEIINTNAQLLALHNHHELNLLIQLVSLGDLVSAPEMYQHLHTLVRARNWICQELTVLEGFSWLARALQGLRNSLQDLQPPAVNPNAALHGPNSVLHTFVEMKQLAIQLERTKAKFRFRIGVLVRRVKHLAKLIKGQSENVVVGSMTVAAFQARIPDHLIKINNILNAGMQF